MTDPIGLGLEQFDGIGQHRTTENDARIDESGELDGRRFADHVELGAALGEHPRLAPCLVENLYKYAVGRAIAGAERGLVSGIADEFAAAGFRLKAAVRAIALSPGLRAAVTAPGDAPPLAAVKETS